MKKKFLEWNEYRKNMKPEEKITFGIKSPFSPINLPPKTVFVGWHGALSPTLAGSGAQGTFYVCRSDTKDLLPFNFDIYFFILANDESRLEVIHQKPQKLEYHWTKDIPIFIRKQMPKWAQNRIQNFLTKE